MGDNLLRAVVVAVVPPSFYYFISLSNSLLTIMVCRADPVTCNLVVIIGFDILLLSASLFFFGVDVYFTSVYIPV